MRYRIVALLIAVLAGCTAATADPWEGTLGLKVVASFAPVQCFTLNVAGPDASVKGIMTTQGPHHYDASPSDAKLLAKADVVLFNGLALDDGIVNRMVRSVGNSKAGLEPLGAKLSDSLLLEGGCKHDHGKDGDHAGHDHGKDPHIWMGLPQAEAMVNGIRDSLGKYDAKNRDAYTRRAVDYVEKLKVLKSEGDKLLFGKKDRKFVCFHESMNYFAKTYDLTVAAVIEDVPGHAPTPKQLEAIVKACVDSKTRVIAVEPQYSAKSAAEQIVAELKRRGVEDPVVITLDPMETATAAEMNAGWYETKMRANLAALAGALK
jgi:zinc transport system substrate-binding protein